MKRFIKNNWVLITIFIIIISTMLFMNKQVKQNNDKMNNIKNNIEERN